MYQSACYPRNEKPIVDLKLNSMLQILISVREHEVQSFGLYNCPWKTIKDETKPVSIAKYFWGKLNRTLPCTPCCSRAQP